MSGGEVFGLPMCWLIVGRARPCDTFGVTARISVNFGGVVVDAYIKDLPVERVEADVLIGYEMNGSVLSAEHGFPARLVVPGFYGTNSVKWLFLPRIRLVCVRSRGRCGRGCGTSWRRRR
jgi:DMSO/TMAO reductase YedYZ molybdopterin-dependent catalytic subunit